MRFLFCYYIYMKTLKSICEGSFFKNVGGWCKPLNDFLKNCVTIKRGNKEYIIHHGLFFDVDDLKQTVFNIMNFKGRTYERTGRQIIENTITNIAWEFPLEHPHIRINYTNKSLNTGSERREQYTFDNIWGSRIDKKDSESSTKEYDLKLKEFIEGI